MTIKEFKNKIYNINKLKHKTESEITIKLEEKDREVLAKSIILAGLYAYYGSNADDKGLDRWYVMVANDCYKWLCEEGNEL